MTKRVTEINRDLRGPRACFSIITIDMQHRNIEALRAIRAVVSAEGVARIRRERDLVVHDNMHSATDGVAIEVHHVEALSNDALTWEGCIAVHQNWNDCGARFVSEQSLFTATTTHHHRVHELKVRRICGQHNSNTLSRRCDVIVRVTLVILDIATTTGKRRRPCFVKLSEDALEIFANDVCEHIESTAMRHAERELLRAECWSCFDDRIKNWNETLAAFESETLLAHESRGEKVLETICVHQLRENALLRFGAEMRAISRTFNALGNPCAGRIEDACTRQRMFRSKSLQGTTRCQRGAKGCRAEACLDRKRDRARHHQDRGLQV